MYSCPRAFGCVLGEEIGRSQIGTCFSIYAMPRFKCRGPSSHVRPGRRIDAAELVGFELLTNQHSLGDEGIVQFRIPRRSRENKVFAHVFCSHYRRLFFALIIDGLQGRGGTGLLLVLQAPLQPRSTMVLSTLTRPELIPHRE